jgi:hypothetical protein
MALSSPIFQAYSPDGRLKPFTGTDQDKKPTMLGDRQVHIDSTWMPGTRWLNLRDFDESVAIDDHIGLLIPAEMMVSREQLYAAALTPKGRFITWVAIRNAFRQGWKFVEEKKKRTPLPPRLHDKLVKLTNEFDLKIWFSVAKSCAAIFGRSLQFIRQINTVGKLKKWEIRVVPIYEEYIDRDDNENIIQFKPIIRIGHSYRQVYIPADQAVLWVNQPDIFGNAEQGIPEHLAAFRTIKRSESIANNFAELVSQKGLGQLEITIADIQDREDAQKWAEAYKQMIRDSIIVKGPQMETKVTPGINSGYDYNGTQQSYYEDTSAATGMPQMRMRGVQTGTVTGSEVDQDNTAEVYSTIQESSERHMKDFYQVITHFISDPSLRGKNYEIDWEFDIKMDKKGRSQKLSTDATTVLTLAEIITVNQAMEILELPLLDGPEGELLLQQWIDQNFPGQVEMSEPETPTGGGLGKLNEPPDRSKQIAQTAQKSPENVGEALMNALNEPEKENEFNMIQRLFKESRKDRIDSDIISDIHLDDIIPKELLARKLVEAGISWRSANTVLKKSYKNGGLSPNVFTAIKLSVEKSRGVIQ